MIDPLPYLTSIGFVPGPAEAHFGSESYLSVLKNCDYIFRKVDGKFNIVFTSIDKSGKTVVTNHAYTTKFQYFSLCRSPYTREVLEAVFEEYIAEKNTRRPKGEMKSEELVKRGFATSQIGICRKFDDSTSNDLDIRKFL
jgi:hypothetical protein